MRISTFKAALPLMIVAVLLTAPSCIFSPEEEKVIPPPVDIDWPTMEDRDDVLEVISLAYKYPKGAESSSRYEAILHSQYLFHLSESDYVPGEPTFFTRAEDILSTNWIFDNEASLTLDVGLTGSWEEEPMVDGEPCDNCWVSERLYSIRAQFGTDETVYQSKAGATSVIVIVAPDESDPTKWVLRAMYDTVDGS